MALGGFGDKERFWAYRHVHESNISSPFKHLDVAISYVQVVINQELDSEKAVLILAMDYLTLNS